MPAEPRDPSLPEALVPVALLMGLLALAVYLFGGDSSAGPNQIALIVSAAAAGAIGLRGGRRWSDIEAGITRGLSTAMGAIVILLVVGSVIGAWILAGIVPTMIYYGLLTLGPSVFYVAACLICAVAALATGSSWTTAGTIGVALIGTAAAQDLHPGLAGGAIISGAYFGDKMSPLSDTTNLAPAVSGTDVFTHIRHMVWTTAPSFAAALVLFTLAGLLAPPAAGGGSEAVDALLQTLTAEFAIGPHLLLPLVVVLGLIARKVPAFPALLIGALLGGLFAVVFQQPALLAYVGESSLPRGLLLLKGVWMALYGGFALDSGNAVLDDLLSRGGMNSMLGTVGLILAAMMFGAVMEVNGMLRVIAARILRAVRGAGSLIAATLATAVGTNMIASDQYISIVLPGRMFRDEYRRRSLDPKNLSRSLEDAGTLTSVLVPWNTCGAFMAQTLGVATLAYAPFAFFNLLCPLVSGAFGFANVSIARLPAPGGAASR